MLRHMCRRLITMNTLNMKTKRKVGRPRKVNYKPTIEITYSDNLIWDIMTIKRQLGMPLMIGELRDLVNHDLAPYGIKVQLTVKPKISWFKKILNIFRGKKN